MILTNADGMLGPWPVFVWLPSFSVRLRHIKILQSSTYDSSVQITSSYESLFLICSKHEASLYLVCILQTWMDYLETWYAGQYWV